MKRLIGLLMLLACATAWGQTPISALPAASAATGTEAVPVVQSATTKRMTVQQFATFTQQYVLAQNNTWGGNNNFTGSVNIDALQVDTSALFNGWQSGPGTSGATGGSGAFFYNDGPSFFNLGITSSGYTGTVVTGGPSGQQLYVGTQAGLPLTLYTASVARITIGAGGGIQIGAPTGGDLGVGTLNSPALYINGVAVANATSGVYSATVTGYSSLSTANVKWALNGKQVTVFIPVISGTSNATNFQVSILAGILPVTSQFISVPIGITTDNSLTTTDAILNINNGGNFQFYHNSSATGWTATGLKGSGGFSFSYLLN